MREGGASASELERAPDDSGTDLSIRLDVETLARLYIGALSWADALLGERMAVLHGVERIPELDRATALPRPWTFDRF